MLPLGPAVPCRGERPYAPAARGRRLRAPRGAGVLGTVRPGLCAALQPPSIARWAPLASCDPPAAAEAAGSSGSSLNLDGKLCEAGPSS